jgi:hypothetical protein
MDKSDSINVIEKSMQHLNTKLLKEIQGWFVEDNVNISVADPEISKRGARSRKGGPPPEIEKKFTYFGSQSLSFTNIRW